jgi:hypothetical protein
MQENTTKQESSAPKCGCGRSPIGHCIGWHKLTEDEFRQKLAEWDSNIIPTKNDLVD